MIRAENVSFGYDPARPVLHSISLEVRAGELLALVGPNGAGKTTLLNVLSGYLAPASGGVYLRQQPLGGLSRREVAQQIAVVPQRSHAAFAYSVLHVVLMGRHPYKGFAALDTPEDLQIAAEALALVGLTGFSDRSYDELSGGEQRLVLLARALAQQTPVLLLDEPMAELDLRHQLQILNRMKSLATSGSAVLATFHDLNTAARWSDRIAILDRGNLQACGKPGDTLQLELLQKIYGVPLSLTGLPHIDFAEIPAR